ncbi:TadE/TadG family type IV pilus assembly protein [Rhodoferax sediminis]|uniref:Pilus assembly protein n=1 Tax=Rhodoferax sediminis TaxID=2509614 RepID=A0A515D9P4_9BURK|nr:TadE/TadG family type IV pilus assembly protein [Rhodoferax sediminis]QDL37127.1 pilus assembly protein [Rhodoferax sediminis]
MNTHRKQRGVAAVELGILLIPLVLLVFGITEFGRAIYQYNTLVKATRNAARFLSAQGPGDPADVTTAQCLAVYGNQACTGSALVPALTAAMVSVCDSVSCPTTNQNQPTGSGVINLVTVTITGYPFTSLVPFVMPSITFGDISTTMRQVL